MVNNLKKILKYSILVIIILSLSILIMPISTIYKNNYIEYYDCDGNIIKSEIDKKTSKYVYLNELNNYSINAFIAYEDKNFYKHNGFDLPRIIKSLFQNIGNKGISSGASTITQQLLKNNVFTDWMEEDGNMITTKLILMDTYVYAVSTIVHNIKSITNIGYFSISNSIS